MDDVAVVDWKGLKELGIAWSRTHIWRKMRAGHFPKCFKLADDPKARVVWMKSEIRDWVLQRASRRCT